MCERRKITALLPVEKLLKPRSLAFVGVSSKGGAGAKMLQSARDSGFLGDLWPVNPSAGSIAGVTCVESLAALPQIPDCLVVAVPAAAVVSLLRQAAHQGIRNALVVSEGFADAGTPEGEARQRELVALAHASGMAVAGPNCMGIASLRHGFAATMADIPDSTVAGGISLVSQSGGLLNAVAELAANRGIGLNYLISSGNGAVVDIGDYIDYLADDPATSVIACIMEGVHDGRRFRGAIERAARNKPLVVLKLGRSSSGQKATLAHTGTLAGRHEAFMALFQQNGVACAHSIDALVETAALLDAASLPKGDGVAMLTVSGGATALISDLGEAAGLRFPQVADATNRCLQRILGVERNFANPIDTVGLPRLRAAGNLAAIVDALMEDDGIDVIGLALGMRKDGAESHQEFIQSMAAAVKTATKPLLVVSFMSNSLTSQWRGDATKHGLPIVEDLGRGLQAVRSLIDYAAFRRRITNALPEDSRCQVFDTLPSFSAGATLTEAESKKILAAAGLPVTREALARTPEEAVALATRIGGPVVLKVQSPDIPHKSDVGGVHLGAHTPADIERAARWVLDNARRASPDADIHGVLVQELIEDGVEFILGMIYDEQFGPLVVLGAGGVAVELFKDVEVRLPPLSTEGIRDMIAGLKSAKLLAPFRGRPARDIAALVDCAMRFAGFCSATDGRFAAIDLNPVMVRAEGLGVRVADALIVTRRIEEEVAT
jgi:acyl-CoA synthetase (NDP forming)